MNELQLGQTQSTPTEFASVFLIKHKLHIINYHRFINSRLEWLLCQFKSLQLGWWQEIKCGCQCSVADRICVFVLVIPERFYGKHWHCNSSLSCEILCCSTVHAETFEHLKFNIYIWKTELCWIQTPED